MNSEWKEVRLGDLISLRGGLAYKGEHISQSGTPMVTMGCVDPGSRFKREGLKYYRGSFGASHTAKSGDIVIATRDVTQKRETIGCPCLIPDDLGSEEAVVATNTYLVTNHSNIDNSFLYLLLKSPSYREQIVASAKGSTVIMITKDAIENHSFLLPPPVEQKAIAHILGTLDDKIELNRKTNETLEGMAKALFKSWFVDFDPVRAKAEGRPTGLPAEVSDLFPDSFEDSELGDIPSGWEVHLLGEAVSIQYGKNLPTLNLIPKGFPVFGGNGVIGFHSDYLFEDVMTLVSCRGAASGAVLRSLPKSFVTNNSLVIDHRNTSVPSQRYVEFFLSNTDTSVFVTGSAQPQVTIDSIRHLPILIPQSRLVEVFQDDLAPIGIKALLVDRQSKCLASTRDALLPKLISGEIRIPDAEKMLEEVGI